MSKERFKIYSENPIQTKYYYMHVHLQVVDQFSLASDPHSHDSVTQLSSHEIAYKDVEAAVIAGDVFSAMLTGTPCQPYKWWHLRNQWREELRFSENLQVGRLGLHTGGLGVNEDQVASEYQRTCRSVAFGRQRTL